MEKLRIGRNAWRRLPTGSRQRAVSAKHIAHKQSQDISSFAGFPPAPSPPSRHAAVPHPGGRHCPPFTAYGRQCPPYIRHCSKQYRRDGRGTRAHFFKKNTVRPKLDRTVSVLE